MASQKVFQTTDPTGYVVVNDLRFPQSIGGIRLIKGVTQDEVAKLAEAMSLKLHTYGIPLAGAKSGIDSDDVKQLPRFVKQITSLLLGKEGHTYIAGPDIGTTEMLFHEALQNNGLPQLIKPGLLSQVSETYGLPLDNVVTALGVVVVIEEILKSHLPHLRNQDPLIGRKISLEGFGKVGTGIAKLLDDRAQLVAVSTRFGCIVAKNGNAYCHAGGFDIRKLIVSQAQYGDHFIEHVGLEVLPSDELFSVPTDIIIPGARTGVITSQIAEVILQQHPIAIVPVANAPYTREGLELLERGGVLCFPDFVASAGAIIAAMVEFAHAGGEEEAMNLVAAATSQETIELLFAIKSCIDPGRYLYDIAVDRANERRDMLVVENTSNRSMAAIAEEVIERYNPGIL